MATAEQLKALVRSYTEGDNDRFLAVAMQIAAHAARTGKEKLAQELQALVDGAKKHRPLEVRPRSVPFVRTGSDLAGLVTATFPKTRLADMVLAPVTRSRLDRVVLEYREADRLLAHGLPPRRKLLLIGPPGSGKTMTASALAGELSLPLLAVQLHALISRFMGETAAKLHLVFDAMSRTRGVYLFDEFDAIGGRRVTANDVGEIRRILNSFLQFLERDGSDSIIIAATNLVETLDDALFRRFDDVVRYGLPSEELAKSLIRNHLAAFDIAELAWESLLPATHGLSHAEITRACADAAKDAVLAELSTITTESLAASLAQRLHRE
ncbi:MAG: ATP-dependent zinc metalloprotease FtsH [Planctomycetes bacterium ADurb.Bin126]|nr:MAG: ATP-dependent zinc metalloprotease FtsH [Planctomycetes bacterium ADurb.Bin126]HOD83236.1 ATP-binding protein [Phycisphaerae bacterium]HQL71831.1 ATP-binding protein [Phycisphaerae bacterium]